MDSMGLFAIAVAVRLVQGSGHPGFILQGSGFGGAWSGWKMLARMPTKRGEGEGSGQAATHGAKPCLRSSGVSA